MEQGSQEKNKYVERPHKRRKKAHWFLCWLLCFIILLAIPSLAFLYLSPMTRNLYVQSKIRFFSDIPFTEQEKHEITDLFEGSYLFQNDDGKYCIVDLESGLGFALSDLQEADVPEELDISIDTSGNFAVIYLDINSLNLNSRVTISFFKASFMERVRFVLRYSW